MIRTDGVLSLLRLHMSVRTVSHRRVEGSGLYGPDEAEEEEVVKDLHHRKNLYLD